MMTSFRTDREGERREGLRARNTTSGGEESVRRARRTHQRRRKSKELGHPYTEGSHCGQSEPLEGGVEPIERVQGGE